MSTADQSCSTSGARPAPQSSAWGSLRPPSASDLARKGRGGHAGKEPEPFSHLVVLDFEWTADNRRPVRPISEITQFPSVLVCLRGRSSSIISEFDTFVRPTLNPVLTDFSIDLTGINQSEVDGADILTDVLPQYLSWLRTHSLVDEEGTPVGRWAICTWSDADIGGQLSKELRHKNIPIPPCFNSWINLKVLYKRHYRREPRGGLQHCVERLGLDFEGRAHNGLIDSRNTAKIVLHMAKGSDLYPAFTFRRATRGLDRNGLPFGSRERASSTGNRVASGGVAGRTGKRPPMHEHENKPSKRRIKNPYT